MPGGSPRDFTSGYGRWWGIEPRSFKTWLSDPATLTWVIEAYEDVRVAAGVFKAFRL